MRPLGKNNGLIATEPFEFDLSERETTLAVCLCGCELLAWNVSVRVFTKWEWRPFFGHNHHAPALYNWVKPSNRKIEKISLVPGYL